MSQSEKINELVGNIDDFAGAALEVEGACDDPATGAADYDDYGYSKNWLYLRVTAADTGTGEKAQGELS